MASIAQLNVRIGGDIRALDKALKDAERSVRKAGANLSAMGNELSMKLSLPMLAFGAASIKAAGDIEALNKSMQATFAGAGRSIGEANGEIVALRKAAEAPGLDFEQAIKASIRLQGVGLQAEAARRTIEQLANAISTTGGTAENLNSVTVQFSQMIAKGKIMASDLRIVQENMPVISRLMEETFGTSNSERLQEMGVSGKEFVEKITAAMAKLPRVQGGISNAIVNAGVSIKMFLASVGESLNKTFNITNKLEGFSSWLDRAAKAFSSLDDGTKRAIAGVALFAVTLGPMIKAGNIAVMVGWKMYEAYLGLQKVLLESLAGKAVPGAIAAFRALDTATKLTAIGAAIGVVLALAAAFMALRKDTSDAALAAKTVEDVNKTAAAAIVDQKTKVDSLVKAYKDENITLDGKKSILEQLKQISPAYFDQIKIGKGDVDALTLAQGRYNDELLRTAKVQAAKDKIAELYKTMLDGEAMTDPSIWQTLGNFISSMGNASAFAGNQVKTIASNLQENTRRTMAQIDALGKFVTAQEVTDANTKKFTETTNNNSESAKKNADAWEKAVDAMHKAELATRNAREELEYGDIKSSNRVAPGIQTLTKPTDAGFADRFAAGMERVKAAAAEAGKSIGTMVESLDDKMQRWADGFSEKIGQWPEHIMSAAESISGLFDAISARNIDNLNKEMEAKLVGVKKGSAEELKIRENFQAQIDGIERRAAKRAKALAILEATIMGAQGVLKGLLKGGLPGAFAAGALAAIQIAKIVATPLAKGGIVSGPTHALVGEYPGASSNPEVVAPLDKLKGMLRDTGGYMQVGGTFRVQGSDLLLVLEKAQKGRGRVSGY